jgi:hypothetical protein
VRRSACMEVPQNPQNLFSSWFVCPQDRHFIGR